MKVMVIVKATQSSEAGKMPSTELLAAMGKYNEELVHAGIMQDGAGLKPSSHGARVRFSGANRMVIDGPFAETKELIAGFWVWEVESLQHAIDWVKKCPNPMPEESEIEIRPYVELADFGEAFTPELQEQEAAIRAVGLGLNQPTFQDNSELCIAGINRRYSMETRLHIPRQWEAFVPRASEIKNAGPVPFFGVSWNTQANCDFDYLTGLEIYGSEELPSDMIAMTLPAGRYAVFSHTGHVSALPKTIDCIWTKWVPDCGLAIAKSPCFELYTSEFNPMTGMGGMEVWIPISG